MTRRSSTPSPRGHLLLPLIQLSAYTSRELGTGLQSPHAHPTACSRGAAVPPSSGFTPMQAQQLPFLDLGGHRRPPRPPRPPIRSNTTTSSTYSAGPKRCPATQARRSSRKSLPPSTDSPAPPLAVDGPDPIALPRGSMAALGRPGLLLQRRPSPNGLIRRAGNRRAAGPPTGIRRWMDISAVRLLRRCQPPARPHPLVVYYTTEVGDEPSGRPRAIKCSRFFPPPRRRRDPGHFLHAMRPWCQVHPMACRSKPLLRDRCVRVCVNCRLDLLNLLNCR